MGDLRLGDGCIDDVSTFSVPRALSQLDFQTFVRIRTRAFPLALALDHRGFGLYSFSFFIIILSGFLLVSGGYIYGVVCEWVGWNFSSDFQHITVGSELPPRRRQLT